MSVSQFPYATMVKAEELFKLTEQLIPNLDPALSSDIELIISAYSCAMIEQAVNMQKLKLYQALDPVIMRKIQDTLNSCR